MQTQNTSPENNHFVSPEEYQKVISQVPFGKVITLEKIREHFIQIYGKNSVTVFTSGIFVLISAWNDQQNSLPYWRVLKSNGELNAKYPNGILAQKQKLESEGHTIIQKGRQNIHYFVKNYEDVLTELK